MIGSRVAHYEIRGPVGEGGMGIVYAAWDTNLDRKVALKFVKPEVIVDERWRGALLREARAAACLDHPNICTIYEIGDTAQGPYIAMAYLEGRTLAQRLTAGPLELEAAVDVALQVGRGLASAHAKGVAHRDINPKNVMLAPDGRVRIMDFGLATLLRGPAAEDLARGTLVYMAPEQLRGEPAAIGCDVWGWGSLVYEALIGRAPFARGDAAGVIHAILHEKPPYPSSLEVRVPQALRELVDRALDKRPEQRFASLEEALPALERIQGDAESTRITLPWRPVRPGPSIAVLAFADMSVDGDYEHFCDGISEEIISDLSRVEGLRVISRTSSFSFKDKSADVREIGQQLGVGTVLEGSVRVSGDRLRVTAQLIDTSDGAHLWVERYDRALANVFDIQEDIARRIVGALSVRLSPAEDEALAITRTRNVRAYDYYLRGRRFFYRTSKENIARAVGMYERAAAEDPAFALAHAGLSFCHAYLFTYFDPDPLQRQEAVETAQRALILAPDLAEAHAAYGLALSLVPDFQQADREFRSAVELDPHLFEGYYFHARACTVQGRHAEAAELFGRAHDVRPEEYQALCLRGFELRTIGELEASRKTYEIVFQNVVRHLRLVPDDARAIYMGAEALLELGQRERAMRWARRVERLAAADPYNVYGLACFYARQGDVEQGLAFLERAVGLGFTYKEWIEADSDLDPLHEHPGYQSLVAGLSG